MKKFNYRISLIFSDSFCCAPYCSVKDVQLRCWYAGPEPKRSTTELQSHHRGRRQASFLRSFHYSTQYTTPSSLINPPLSNYGQPSHSTGSTCCHSLRRPRRIGCSPAPSSGCLHDLYTHSPYHRAASLCDSNCCSSPLVQRPLRREHCPGKQAVEL